MELSNISESVLTDLSESCDCSLCEIEDVYACTPIQLGLMADSLGDQRSYVYRDVFSIADETDLDRLCWAIDQVVSQNAILRTRIVDNSEMGLVQVVITDGEIHHTRHRSNISISEFLHEDSNRPMGLGLALWRSTIVGRRWIVTMHHAITDAASGKAVALDVSRIYKGFEPATHTPFKSFVDHCSQIDPNAARQFWSSRFKGVPSIFPRRRDSSIEVCQTFEKRLDLSDVRSYVSAALLPSYLEAAWALTVQTYTEDTEIAFGMVYSGRASAPTGLESTLGPTLTTIPLQVSLQPDMKIKDLLKERAHQRRQLQAHSALQYGLKQISASSEAARIASKFETVINLLFDQSSDSVDAKLFKFEFTHNASSPYGLMLTLKFDALCVVDVEALYKISSFCPEEMRHILRQFEHVLRWLVSTPPGTAIQELPILNSDDRQEILRWNHDSLPDMVESTLNAIITAQARNHPNEIAVDAKDRVLSYQELESLSSFVAEELTQRGVAGEHAVPFMFEKSAWAIVAILAILKAGGACVPLDPDHPVERKQYVLEATGATLVLASPEQRDEALRICSNVLVVDETIIPRSKSCETTSQIPPEPNHCAFILFTSGSTGQPKGVAQEHRSLVTSLSRLRSCMGMRAGLRVLQFASFIWDISLLEIFGSLLSGATLCMPSEGERKGSLPAFINSRKIDWMILTPTVLRTINPDEIPNVRTIASAGEPVDSGAFATWGKGRRFLNAWGPTEAAMANTVAELHPDSLYPETIGNALNCAIWIVNPETLCLVPIGATGEILIEGPTVARGYLHPTEFSPFISPQEWAPPTWEQRSLLRRLYRTGDLARYNSDGSLCYVGRNDSQVKLHGQRFELGEVESVLGKSGFAKDVFVTVQNSTGLNGTSKSGGGRRIEKKQLAVVVSPAKTGLPSDIVMQEFSANNLGVAQKELEHMKNYLKKRLPSFMVPSLWVLVERLPRTATDKLDRKAMEKWLEIRTTSRDHKADGFETNMKVDPPVGDNEKLLQDVWSSLLGVAKEQIDRQNSFIELGGDSILAMQVVRRCRSKGLEVTTPELLRGITLCTIAESGHHNCSDHTLDCRQHQSGKSSTDDQNHRSRTDSDINLTSNVRAAVSSQLSRLRSELEPFKKGQSDLYPRADDIEAAAPAHDAQKLMIAFGEMGTRAFYNQFRINPSKKGLDITTLQAACDEVLKQHSILRTIFIQVEKNLYQAVRSHVSHSQIVVGEDNIHLPLSTTTSLACFHLVPDRNDSNNCIELRFLIHHALYDAWSIGIVLRDLRNAYAGHQLTPGPSFLQWAMHNICCSDEDGFCSTLYWQKLLNSSSMTYLAPNRQNMGCADTKSESIKVEVPLGRLYTPYGTPATAFKAAWALFLSHASGTDDILFGEVNANRDESFTGSEMVCGPCAIPVPARARLVDEKKLGTLIEQLQEQSLASSSHLQVAIRSVMKECTRWSVGAPFGSLIAFQNHRSLPSSFEFVDGETCNLSAIGTAGELAQIWIVAVPASESLTIDITYFPYRIQPQQATWVAECFSFILNNLHSNLANTVGEFKGSLLKQSFGPVMPSLSAVAINQCCHGGTPAPSEKAKDLVARAWAEVGLEDAYDNDQETIFDHGADVVTAFLLSEHFKYGGYPVDARDVVEHPSQRMLASLLDEKVLSRHDSVTVK